MPDPGVVLANLIAYVLTSAFYRFNLKPQARKDCSLSSLIRILWMTLDELAKPLENRPSC